MAGPRRAGLFAGFEGPPDTTATPLGHGVNSSVSSRVLFSNGLSPPKVSKALREAQPGAEAVLRDSNLVLFLDLPDGHREADLHQGLVRNLRRFPAELGCDFCFVGSEVPLQVGGRDFVLDVLFFHYALSRALSPALVVAAAAGACGACGVLNGFGVPPREYVEIRGHTTQFL